MLSKAAFCAPSPPRNLPLDRPHLLLTHPPDRALRGAHAAVDPRIPEGGLDRDPGFIRRWRDQLVPAGRPRRMRVAELRFPSTGGNPAAPRRTFGRRPNTE